MRELDFYYTTKSPTLIRACARTSRMKVGLSLSETAAAQPRPATHTSGAVATTTATTSFPLPPHCSRPLLACSTGPVTQEPIRYSPLRTRSVQNRKKSRTFLQIVDVFCHCVSAEGKNCFPPNFSEQKVSPNLLRAGTPVQEFPGPIPSTQLQHHRGGNHAHCHRATGEEGDQARVWMLAFHDQPIVTRQDST